MVRITCSVGLSHLPLSTCAYKEEDSVLLTAISPFPSSAVSRARERERERLGLGMQTRRGVCYAYSSQTSTASGGCCRDEVVLLRKKRRRRNGCCTTGNESVVVVVEREVCGGSKRRRRTPAGEVMGSCDSDESDLFDVLPDDIVISIFCKLSSTASFPSDIASALTTCKRFRRLVKNPLVLSKASAGSLAVSADKWSESAHRFLKECADVGNLEACYILGMIRFYCLQNRGTGASLMARAAIGSHAAALYALAIIQFNGSGGSKNDKDLRAGVALCARAAFLGHIDAIRELGHCLQDGYGVRQNVAEGRRFLVQANARELASVLSSSDKTKSLLYHRHGVANGFGCPLLSDFGCPVPSPEVHPANRFLVDWFASRAVGGEKVDDEAASLRLCSHSGCGRPETRKHEFRRCSVCGAVNYCSRACQALDWKIRHKGECAPMERWLHDIDGGIAAAGIVEINGAAGVAAAYNY